VVNPGAEKENLKSEIAAKMKAWTDEPNSQPVVRRIYRNEEIFRGDQAPKAPDLLSGLI